jgi:hypothetical protein
MANDTEAASASCELRQLRAPSRMSSHEPRLTLTLSEEEARWLATAATVLRRILEGLPAPSPAPAPDDVQTYGAAGLAALHRVAERLPAGYYLPDEDTCQKRSIA